MGFNKTDQELASKLVDLSLAFVRESDEIYLESLNIREKMIRNELVSKYDAEPLGIFKKKHQQWENEINELENELSNIYKKAEAVISDFEQ